MKATVFSFIAAILTITMPLDAMNFMNKAKKKSPTQKCHDGIEHRSAKKVARAIAKGADVNHVFTNGMNEEENFLQFALSTRNRFIITELLKAPNLEINRHPIGTLPPLHCAVCTGQCEPVELLLNHPNANINILDEQGNTSLFTAVNCCFAYSLCIGKRLLDKNMDTAITNKKGDTILHYISELGYIHWLELILTVKNPPLNVQNKIGNTPLHILCRKNAYQLIKKVLLSNHFIDFDILNNNGESVFDIALDSEYDEIISFFLDAYPGQLTPKHREDRRVFDYAIRANNVTLLEKLLPSRHINTKREIYSLTPLMIASRKGHAATVNLLLKQKNCTPLYKDQRNRIALHYACENGHLACVEKLLKYGDLNTQDDFQNTPLHLASSEKKIKVINYLIEKGANTLLANKNGSIPFLIIYKASIQNDIDKKALEHLLRARDKDNNTLFHLLTKTEDIVRNDTYDYDKCLKFLIDYGIDIHTRNNKGFTALDMVNGRYWLPLAVSSKMAQSFWRITSDRMSYDSLKEVLKILPKDLHIFILILYYQLNIKTVSAKIFTKFPLSIDHYPYQQRYNLEKELPNDLYYFPLLYRPAVLSYE